MSMIMIFFWSTLSSEQLQMMIKLLYLSKEIIHKNLVLILIIGLFNEFAEVISSENKEID